MIIDVAIPGDRNVIMKGAEKILKYKELIIKIQHVWKLKAKVIPLIIGVTGTISKLLRQYLSNMWESRKLRNYKKQPYWALHT